MLTYVIESKKGPLMVIGSASEETIKQYVNRFPQKSKVNYREIGGLEEAKEIEGKINGKLAEILIEKNPEIKKLATILIKKYCLTQTLKSLDEKLN